MFHSVDHSRRVCIKQISTFDLILTSAEGSTCVTLSRVTSYQRKEKDGISVALCGYNVRLNIVYHAITVSTGGLINTIKHR